MSPFTPSSEHRLILNISPSLMEDVPMSTSLPIKPFGLNSMASHSNAATMATSPTLGWCNQSWNSTILLLVFLLPPYFPPYFPLLHLPPSLPQTTACLTRRRVWPGHSTQTLSQSPELTGIDTPHCSPSLSLALSSLICACVCVHSSVTFTLSLSVSCPPPGGMP